MTNINIAFLPYSYELQNILPSLPVWKTCLRTIVFFNENELDLIKNICQKENLKIEILKDEYAYQYILEVICGLKSEILGETQVLGQFKIFLNFIESNYNKFYLNHYSIFKSLLHDCKELRENYIQNWGGSTYGSLTRKIVEESTSVFILGNGQLSQSLLPWLKQKNNFIFGRNPKKPNESKLEVENIKSNEKTSEKLSLVIAAPIDNLFLNKLINCVDFEQIIDWRTESHIEKKQIPEKSKYHSFQHLAEFMRSENEKKQKHIENLNKIVQYKIKEWSDRKTNQLIHRPKGWDDLC